MNCIYLTVSELIYYEIVIPIHRFKEFFVNIGNWKFRSRSRK